MVIIIDGVDRDWLFALLMQMNKDCRMKVAGPRFQTSKRRLLTELVVHRRVERLTRGCCGCRNFRWLQGVPEKAAFKFFKVLA